MFIFFKQKTAYELRISDCSSDVCSSDLTAETQQPVGQPAEARWHPQRPHPPAQRRFGHLLRRRPARIGGAQARGPAAADADGGARPYRRRARTSAPLRSEEHTSELQSLMRTSYAVFCLKKTTTHQPFNTNHN